MTELTDNQISMMKHALGYANANSLEPGWRNHYATEPGCPGWDDWCDLAEKGWAINRGQMEGGLHILSVTLNGRQALDAALEEKSPGANRG